MSGLLIYPVLNLDWTWPTGWLALGVSGLIFSLWPAKFALQIGGASSAKNNESIPWQRFHIIILGYFLFGVGYIVYLTFVIAWLREMQLGNTAATAIWLVLGAACMASGYVWKGVMARWQPTSTFAAAAFCTALGTALPLASQSLATLLISAVLVGGSFFMVPGAMMALTRKELPQHLWAKAMNFFTMIFAIGQAAGPVAAGWIADTYGMDAAMAAGAGVLMLAAGLAKLQRCEFQ